MDEQKNDMMQGYAALNDVPCDSPLHKIDPDDMMMLMFLLLMFSEDQTERNPESMREQIRRMLEKASEKEGGENDVQQTDERA